MEATLDRITAWFTANFLYYSLLAVNTSVSYWERGISFVKRTWQGAVDAHLDRWYLFLDRNTYPIITKGPLHRPHGCKIIYNPSSNRVIGHRMPRKFDEVVLAQLKNINDQSTYDMSFFFNGLVLEDRVSLLEIVLIFCIQEGVFLPIEVLKSDYRVEILNSEAETLVNVLEEENFTIWPALKEDGEIVEEESPSAS
jgi:hypothetical protein